MNRSVITTARDVEETEREREREREKGGGSWKGKNCCMLYRKRTIAAIPRLDEVITEQFQGRAFVLFLFPNSICGAERKRIKTS